MPSVQSSPFLSLLCVFFVVTRGASTATANGSSTNNFTDNNVTEEKVISGVGNSIGNSISIGNDLNHIGVYDIKDDYEEYYDDYEDYKYDDDDLLREQRCELRRVTMDAIFLIDGSYSIKPTDFRKGLRFVASFVDYLMANGIEVGRNATRIAVIQFSDDVHVRFINSFLSKRRRRN